MRWDVSVEAERYVVYYCNVYYCIMKLHNSMSSSKRLVDMIVSISLCLALSSKCLCNFFYSWHYILKKFLLLSFIYVVRANFYQIEPYVNRPFCSALLWHCWFGYAACKNRPRNDLLCVGWDVKPYSLHSTMSSRICSLTWMTLFFPLSTVLLCGPFLQRILRSVLRLLCMLFTVILRPEVMARVYLTNNRD